MIADRTVRRAVLVALVFGIACRASQYAANTSLWHDEAYVALNATGPTWSGLFGRPGWNDPSPPGFLVVERLAVSALGRSETALRLVPFAAGVASVVAFASLAVRTQVGAAALWSVVLLAASEKLVVQANETKHFTLDLLFAVLLSACALRALSTAAARGPLFAWGLLGAIGPWLTYASTFVFAGTSIALAPRMLRGERRLAYLLANLAAAASFALLWETIRAQVEAPVLGFWREAFPDLGGPIRLVGWLGRALLGLFNYFWQPLGISIAATAIVGGVVWWRTGRRPLLAVLVLPMLVALAASFLHRWPFGGNQHMTFAAAGVLLLAGAGIETIRERLTSGRAWAAPAFVAGLLLPGVVDAAWHVAFPRTRHEARPVIEFVTANRRSDDQLLVFCPAEFEFYRGRIFPDPPPAPDPSLRVWFVGTRSGNDPFPNQELLDRLSSRRARLLAHEEDGAAAYLFAAETEPPT